MNADRRARNLGYFSHEAAARFPDRPAIIDLSRTPAREVTYAELEARLDRVARLVTERGLGPGDRVAMAVGNRFEFVEIMYGLMRAGVVPVPLNIKLGRDQLAYIVADARCRAAFVEPGSNRFVVDVVRDAGLRPCFAFEPLPEGFEPY
ncbi:MAG: AMP-binding protein, partial [Pseudomonadota bacterium]